MKSVRGFRKRYEAKIKDALRKKKSPKKVIVKKLRGRPCLLGDKIDPLIQNYLKATRYKEGFVNSGGNSDCKSLTEAISMSRKRKFNNRKILGSKSFSTYGLCSWYQNHWEGTYSGQGTKGSRAEILASNL